jgi:hypothetical protein
MTVIKQTEFNSIEFTGVNGTGTIVTETTETSITELSEGDLDAVSGGASHGSDAGFSRHRTSMTGENFAGPDGAGSSFGLKREDVDSSSQDFMAD